MQLGPGGEQLVLHGLVGLNVCLLVALLWYVFTRLRGPRGEAAPSPVVPLDEMRRRRLEALKSAGAGEEGASIPSGSAASGRLRKRLRATDGASSAEPPQAAPDASSEAKRAPTPPPPDPHAAAAWENLAMERIFRVSVRARHDEVGVLFLHDLATELQTAVDPAAAVAGTAPPVGLRAALHADRCLREWLAKDVAGIFPCEPSSGCVHLVRCFRRAATERAPPHVPAEAATAALEAAKEAIARTLAWYLTRPEEVAAATGRRPSPPPPGRMALEGPLALLPHVSAALGAPAADELPEDLRARLAGRLHAGEAALLYGPLVSRCAEALEGPPRPDLLEPFESPLGALLFLGRDPRALAALAAHPHFLLDEMPAAGSGPDASGVEALRQSGRDRERFTTLGVILGIGVCPEYFSPTMINVPGALLTRAASAIAGGAAPPVLSPAWSANVLDVLSLRCDTHLALAADLFRRLLRGDGFQGGPTRARTLRWAADLLNSSADRAKEGHDPAQTSSNTAMLNLSAVLLAAFRPLLRDEAAAADTLARVHPALVDGPAMLDGASSAPLVDFASATRLAAPQGTPEPFPPVRDPFPSQLYVLCARALHLGLAAVVRRYDHVCGQLERAQLGVETATAEGDHGALAVWRSQVEAWVQAKICFDAHLLRPGLLLPLSRFLPFACRFVHRLSVEDPAALAALPEHFLDDALDLLFFFVSRAPPLDEAGSPWLAPPALAPLASLAAALAGRPDRVRSPYLRAKLASVLGRLLARRDHPRLSPADAACASGARELLPALGRLYCDVAVTGSQNQYMEKYNLRRAIAPAIERLWEGAPEPPDPAGPLPPPSPHRTELFWRGVAAAYEAQTAAEREAGHLLRFASALVADATFLLDEGLACLATVRSIEAGTWRSPRAAERAAREARRRAAEAEGAPASPSREDEGRPEDEGEDPEERRRALSQAESHAAFHLATARPTLRLLQAAARDWPAPFLHAAVVERLASALCRFLRLLAGEGRASLKVRNPDQYGFDPKFLLGAIMEISVSLSAAPAFLRALVSDRRSYSHGLLLKATEVALQHRGVASPVAVVRWQLLTEQARLLEGSLVPDAAPAPADRDAPDEFLCPLSCEVMEDPVRLPSGKVVDRSAILQHVLGGEGTDPFSRAPLAPGDLAPLPELRARIAAWRAAAAGAEGDEGDEAPAPRA